MDRNDNPTTEPGCIGSNYMNKGPLLLSNPALMKSMVFIRVPF